MWPFPSVAAGWSHVQRCLTTFCVCMPACACVCTVCDEGVYVQSYYSFSVAQLQQPGFSAVSTPTHARNQPAATDFLDIGNFARERVHLTSVGADNKFALNSSAFMARGYSLWRVLRRMEMENVDTAYLGWISYAMHIESRQATLAAMTTNAPITSVLAPTHPPTVLSQVCFTHVMHWLHLVALFPSQHHVLSSVAVSRGLTCMHTMHVA